MAITKRIGFATTITVAVSLLCVYSFHKIFVRNIQEEITGQLRQEIRKIVREELKTDITEVKNILPESRSSEVIPKNSKRTKIAASSAKSDSWKKLSHDIKALVKDELEFYTAGESVSETPITGGLKKKYEASGAAETSMNVSDAGAQASEQQKQGDEPGNETSARVGKERVIEKTLVEKGGMLLPKGKLQIEPSLTTAHFSSNRINIQGFVILPLVIGTISTEKVQRDIFIPALSLKYGLLHNLQGEVKVPYRYEYDRVTDNVGRETRRNLGGLGDAEFAISRQIAYERGFIPDTIFSLSTKTITGKSPYNREIGLGTGHWAVRGSLIAAKSSDPAVVYGSLSYTWNIKRNIEDFGKVDPGDTIGYSLGTAIALSYQTAINFGFEHSVTFKMKKDGIHVNGSFLNTASLKYGFTWSISERVSVDFSVSTGLTSDAPDYVIETRIPITF